MGSGQWAVKEDLTADRRPPTADCIRMTASKEVVISNVHGLHTRPVMKFVDMASQFTSEIKVHKGGTEPADADGKSVMQMIILAAEAGTPLRIEAEGEDAGEAVRQLVELVESKFGEE